MAEKDDAKDGDVRDTRRSFLRWIGVGVLSAGALLSGFPNFRRFRSSLEQGESPLRAINSLAQPDEAAAGDCFAQYAGFCAGVCEGGNCQIAPCQGGGDCQGAGPCQGGGTCQNSVCQGTNCMSGDCQGATCQGNSSFITCGGQIQGCICMGNDSSCTVHIEKVIAALREKGLLKPAPRELTAANFGLKPPRTATQMKPLIQKNILLLQKQGLISK